MFVINIEIINNNLSKYEKNKNLKFIELFYKLNNNYIVKNNSEYYINKITEVEYNYLNNIIIKTS